MAALQAKGRQGVQAHSASPQRPAPHGDVALAMPIHTFSTQPGLRMPCGSSACLMARIMDNATGDL